MLSRIYLHKGRIFVPTVSKTDAGFFMETSPVTVIEARDASGTIRAIEAAIVAGNPATVAPRRADFPQPVVLQYAKVASWAAFEKSAVCWSIRLKESRYQVCPMRKSASKGWEDEPTRVETYATPQAAAQRVSELIAQISPAS